MMKNAVLTFCSQDDLIDACCNYRGIMVIIDAHAHACGELSNVNGILHYLDSNGLEKIILCPGEPNTKKNRNVPMISNRVHNPHLGFYFNKIIRTVTLLSQVSKHIDSENKRVMAYAKEYPDRILQAFWANPLSKNYMEKIEDAYKENDFAMLKLHQCWNKFEINSPSFLNIVQWAGENHKPIFIHLFSPKQSYEFAVIAKKFKTVNFIIGHMIGYEEIVEHTVGQNVYFDISAPFLITVERIQHAVNLLGAERLIIGSDTPYGNDNININIKRVNALNISHSDKVKIFSENILRILS